MFVTEDDGTEVDQDIFGEHKRFDLGDLTLFEALTGGAFDRLKLPT